MRVARKGGREVARGAIRWVARPGWPLLGLLVGACAVAPVGPPGPHGASVPRAFDLWRDAFAFPNLVRAEHPERPGLFANYCLVMVRAANQFFRFARFEPQAAPLAPEAYGALVRRVLAVPPWTPPWPPEQRLVVPGYPDLRRFSAAQEAVIKAAFGSNLPTLLHWRNWRVVWRPPAWHQARLADTLRDELGAGRPVALLITNFPEPDVLNHAVLVYGVRDGAPLDTFLAYDPNDPENPLELVFERQSGRFWVGPLTYGPPGPIRAFRIFASPLL